MRIRPLNPPGSGIPENAYKAECTQSKPYQKLDDQGNIIVQ